MNNSKTRRKFSISFFVIYIGVLVYFLFFAESLGRDLSSRNYSYNLVPFREILRFINNVQILGTNAVILNTLGNVVAFIPFGFFITPVWGKKISFKYASLLTFNISLLVEIIQLITKVGTFDVDDIILNTAGGMIGIMLYFAWKKLERK